MASLGEVNNYLATDLEYKKFYSGAILAGNGLVFLKLALTPMKDLFGSRYIARKPDKTLDQKRAKLRYATKLLERGAKTQDRARGPLSVLAGMAYGITTGAIYAARYNNFYGSRPKRRQRVLGRLRVAGLMLGGGPGMLTGANTTQPLHLTQGWEAYRAIACSGHYYDKGSDDDVDFDLSVSPLEVQFTLSF